MKNVLTHTGMSVESEERQSQDVVLGKIIKRARATRADVLQRDTVAAKVEA